MFRALEGSVQANMGGKKGVTSGKEKAKAKERAKEDIAEKERQDAFWADAGACQRLLFCSCS